MQTIIAVDLYFVFHVFLGILGIGVLSLCIVAATPFFKARAHTRDLPASVVASEGNHDSESEKIQDKSRIEETSLYKELYFKLQSLERYPEILPQARDLLISMFSEVLAVAHKSHDTGILSVQKYTPEKIAGFVKREHDQVFQQWEQYLARRNAGSKREMFEDQQQAKHWLKRVAPIKCVDGGWLGHINKITTPFTLRRTCKDAWQILSEELGDGDSDRNHVHVYRELMREIGCALPEPYTAAFVEPQHGIGELGAWKAAVAQLLISLFPHEFLPEILGFNLKFESVTLETLKVAKELGELKLLNYYFLLHVAIDNADSGHTALALRAVIRYLEHVQCTEGEEATQKKWKRVQTGFILCDGLSELDDGPIARTATESFTFSASEAEVIGIFQAKGLVAHKIHCSSQIRIGNKKLVDWFEPGALASKQSQRNFLESLSNARPWVYKGDSDKSRLIRELSWGGIMFGSFTQNEVEAVKRWIRSTGKPSHDVYWSFVSRTAVSSHHVFQNQDVRVDYPVFSPITENSIEIGSDHCQIVRPQQLVDTRTIKIRGSPNLSKLLPLWFAHPCLLECFICVPSRTTTRSGSSIIRVLRAQYGFDVEGPGVAGMDEARRTESIGLVDLGLEMAKGSQFLEPTSLRDVLTRWPSDFAISMLRWSMRPLDNEAFLFGLAMAFVELHEVIVSSTVPVFSVAHREILRQIAWREKTALQECLEELEVGSGQYASFNRGYNLGILEIEHCFDEK